MLNFGFIDAYKFNFNDGHIKVLSDIQIWPELQLVQLEDLLGDLDAALIAPEGEEDTEAVVKSNEGGFNRTITAAHRGRLTDERGLDTETATDAQRAFLLNTDGLGARSVPDGRGGTDSAVNGEVDFGGTGTGNISLLGTISALGSNRTGTDLFNPTPVDPDGPGGEDDLTDPDDSSPDPDNPIDEPDTPPAPLALFTPGDDIVNFNLVNPTAVISTTVFDALSGFDLVTLPDDEGTADAFGLTGTLFTAGLDGDTLIATSSTGLLVDGNDGDDIFNVSLGANNNTFFGGGGSDTFNVDSSPNNQFFGQSGNDVFNVTNNDGNIFDGGGGNDSFFLEETINDQAFGQGGTDTFNLTRGTGNTVFGGTGADSFRDDEGTNNTLNGEEGNDTFILQSGTTGSSVSGGTGEDTFDILGDSDGNTIIGDGGDDVFFIDGGSDNNTIEGSSGTGDRLDYSRISGSGEFAQVVLIGNSLILSTTNGASNGNTVFGVEEIIGTRGTGRDILGVVGGSDYFINSLSGNDTIAFLNSLNGTLLEDESGNSRVIIDGGGGHLIQLLDSRSQNMDVITVDNSTNNRILIGEGSDEITLTNTTNTDIIGGASLGTSISSDTVTITNGSGNLFLGESLESQSVTLNDTNNNFIFTNSTNDVIDINGTSTGNIIVPGSLRPGISISNQENDRISFDPESNGNTVVIDIDITADSALSGFGFGRDVITGAEGNTILFSGSKISLPMVSADDPDILLARMGVIDGGGFPTLVVLDGIEDENIGLIEFRDLEYVGQTTIIDLTTINNINFAVTTENHEALIPTP